MCPEQKVAGDETIIADLKRSLCMAHARGAFNIDAKDDIDASCWIGNDRGLWLRSTSRHAARYRGIRESARWSAT